MRLVSFILALALIAVGVFYFLNTGKVSFPENLDKLKEMAMVLDKPNPTPFLFEDLTIPYLRARKFESSLSVLDKYQEYSTYTSYLTSYSSGGLKVNGLITVPKGNVPEGGYPAIVFVHGYIAPSIYETTTRYSDYVNYLARNGFVVFKIDLRGHGNSEGEAGGAYYSSDYVIDTLNAHSALENADFVNPKRIGLWGHSMAGNVVFRSMVVKKDIPATVIWAGAGYTYSDLQEYRIMDTSYRAPQQSTERARKRQLLRDTYGEFNSESPFWKLVPATNYLGGVRGRVSLNHAVNDDVVSVEYSRNLNRILNGTSIIHEFNEYPSGGHNLTGSSFTQAMEKTVSFYNKHLLNLD